MATVTIRDESMCGSKFREFCFEIPEEQISAHELLRSRVYQEVKELNARIASQPTSHQDELVPLTTSELELNGSRRQGAEPADFRTQLDRAIEAFKSNQVLILIDGRQVASLEEPIELTPKTDIRFLRLTLLMGG